MSRKCGVLYPNQHQYAGNTATSECITLLFNRQLFLLLHFLRFSVCLYACVYECVWFFFRSAFESIWSRSALMVFYYAWHNHSAVVIIIQKGNSYLWNSFISSSQEERRRKIYAINAIQNSSNSDRFSGLYTRILSNQVHTLSRSTFDFLFLCHNHHHQCH